MGFFKSLFGGNRAGGDGKKAAPAKASPAPTPASAPNPAHVKARKLPRVNVKRRFSIIAETAQGSMSKVYKAFDNDKGRTICLKLQESEITAAALARAAKAERPTEGEIGERVNHPNVCKTYEYGLTSKGEYFLVMEFIDGPSLAGLRQSRVMNLPEKLDFLAQAAEGLAAVHEAGFIHHDVGPKNFLVDQRDDVVKLIDFGLAVPNTPLFHRPGNRTGTLNYMAPELLRRESTDERIDIFSFGVMAFEFLAGRLPYDGATSLEQMLRRINTPPMDPRAANPDLPEDVCELLRKTLARRKEDRWPKMKTIPNALRQMIEARGGFERRPKDDLAFG